MSPVISYLEPKPEILDNFTQIYVSYMPYVRSYFRAYPMDVQQAEDLTQEVFTKVFLHKEHLPGIMNISSWLKAIARNTYMDSLRRTRLQTVSLDAVFYAPEILRLQSETLDESLEYCELKCEIFQVFSDPLERQILYGTICGIPQAQIADMLNIPNGTLRSRLYRMRKKLKQILIDSL